MFRAFAWLLLFMAACAACAQEQKTSDEELLKPGVVVGIVGKAGEAQGAGLQVSDIIVRWSRDSVGGPVNSPFELSLVQRAQAQIGRIRLEGMRTTEARSWDLGSGEWALTTIPNFSGAALAVYREAVALQEKDPSAAVKKLDALRNQLQEPRYGPIRAWLTLRQAVLLLRSQHSEEGGKAFETAAAEIQSDPRLSIEVRLSWADQLSSAGNYAGAEEQYRNALSRADAIEPSGVLSAVALRRAAGMAWMRGNLSQARTFLERGLEIVQKLAPHSQELALDSGQLGMVDQSQGNLADAERHYLQALRVQEASARNDNSYFSSMLILLGNLAIDRGDLIQAEKQYGRAYLIEEKLGPLAGNLSASLIGLGLVAWRRGDLDLAEKHYFAALEANKRPGSSERNTAEALGDLGSVFLDRGDLQKAENYSRQALEVYEKLEPSGLEVAEDLSQLGEIEQRTGNLKIAEEYLKRSLSIAEAVAPEGRQISETLAKLGDAAALGGNTALAENYYRRALAIQAKILTGTASYAQTLASLGKLLYGKGQLEAATSYYEDALRAMEEQTTRLGGSTDNRAYFRARHESYYREYIDLLLKQNKPELAFEASDRSRARSLLEILTTAHIDVRQGVDPALLERERTLQANFKGRVERRIELLNEKHTDEQLKDMDKAIGSISSEYEELESQIRSSSPAYAALTQPRPLTTREIQMLLDQDTLLLEFSLGEVNSHLFAVTPNSLQAFNLPKRADIEEASRRLYESLMRSSGAGGAPSARTPAALRKSEINYREAAVALGRMLLGPVGGQLQRKRLLIVADGALAYVPFAVLSEPFGPAQKAASLAGTRPSAHSAAAEPFPLILNHEIINLPSASVLAASRQQQANRTRPPRAIAVLADPVFSRQDARVQSSVQGSPRLPPVAEHGPSPQGDPVSESGSAGLLTRSAGDLGLSRNGELELPRLRFTRQEAADIAALGPIGQVMEALDFHASRSTAIDPGLSQYRIVHFATHGLLNSEHPELSGLVLSLVDEKGRPQDGFLGLQDVYNLNIPADLVVLSACQTALGKQISGEGLVGLTRGFMYAGASRVVASLWNTSDAATARLMADFYRAMERDGMRPAAALRSAQIRMSKQARWKSPYFWAAFQIQGEWR